MNKLVLAVFSVAVLASSSAFAQQKTRAQVYQELIEAEQNGLAFVTDTSYPAVSPLYETQVAQMKAQASAASNGHDQREQMVGSDK
jgi:purine nucleoside permease